MGVDLIPVFRGRPSTLRVGSSTIYVSIHDQEHLRVRREWKRKLSVAHPDHGGTSKAFITMRLEQARWFKGEAAWYREMKIDPPLPIRDEEQSMAATLALEPPRFCHCGRVIPKRSSHKPMIACSHACGIKVAKARFLGLSPEAYIQRQLTGALGSIRPHGSPPWRDGG